jgi:hypothetical protein
MELRSRSRSPAPADRKKKAAGPGSADVTASVAAAAAARRGPLLVQDDSLSLDDVPDAPFEALCHNGAALTPRNWLIKLWRYTIVPTKELYLPWMFSGLPTNYLMVGGGGSGVGGGFGRGQE